MRWSCNFLWRPNSELVARGSCMLKGLGKKSFCEVARIHHKTPRPTQSSFEYTFDSELTPSAAATMTNKKLTSKSSRQRGFVVAAQLCLIWSSVLTNFIHTCSPFYSVLYPTLLENSEEEGFIRVLRRSCPCHLQKIVAPIVIGKWRNWPL